MISEEQLKYLFNFCHEHGVEYFEVQSELVDHMANLIERDMKSGTALKFTQALENAYNQFGGLEGFQEITNERQQSAFSKAKAEYVQMFKKQFGWPRILEFIGIATLLFIIWDLYPLLARRVGAIVFILFTFTLLFTWLKLNLFNRRKENKFLIIRSSNRNVGMFLIPFNMIGLLLGFTQSPFLFTLIISLSVVMCLIELRLIIKVRNKVEQDYSITAQDNLLPFKVL